MKKFLFILIIIVTSVCNLIGQDKVWINKEYEGPKQFYYHKDINCWRNKHFKSDLTYIEKNEAERYSNKPCSECFGKEELKSEELKPIMSLENRSYSPVEKAGIYLQWSAGCRYACYGITAATIAGVLARDNDRDRQAIAIMGGSLVLIFDILSIHYEYKAGTQLKISANSIQYTF